MELFNVEQVKGFAIVPNYHQRDKTISLKAKGLLSQMFSLPNDWDYTLKGLAYINLDGIDAIRTAVKELEKAGYIKRTRIRDENGRLRGTKYKVYATPRPPTSDSPTLENPTQVNPTQEEPTQENPMQLNIDITNNDELSIKLSNTHSILSDSSRPSVLADLEAKRKEAEYRDIDEYRELIKENIDYDILLSELPYDRDRLEEILELLVETVCSTKKYIRVAGSDYPAEVVRSRLLKLDMEHIRFVFDCLKENTTKIRNIKQYLLTSLYNAPTTIGNYYAKDTSKKVRAVFRSKGQAGKPLCTNPPYGYVKDPADKLHWVVDQEAAETVKLVFQLCINGYGPTQIAKELTRRGIENPVAHGKRNGVTIPAKQEYEDPYFWRTSTIARMLSRQEYLGHTVNFKTKRKSYKQKKQLHNDPSEWQIFENTHEVIIDEETFSIVQRIREGKRRPTRMGEMHMLSGLVFCGDCGNKMYHVRCKDWSHSQEYFTCATYRKQRGGCTSHQIHTDVIEKIVLAQLQSIIRFASDREAEFTEMVLQRSQKARSAELRDKKKGYEQSKTRAAKLDQIMQRLYEDNISGKISDERFAKLSETYEAEQKQLVQRIAELDSFFAADQEQAINLKTFLQHVKQYTNLDHLDAEILRTFIKRIVVTDAMPGKKGKGIEVKLEYTFDGEYKTYPPQQNRKTA